jgi:lipopolysaccharide/colanic/teichoic acid biosynthesis glycosyltransferase
LKNNKVKFSITKYRRMILEKEKQKKKKQKKKKTPRLYFFAFKE